MDNNIKPKVLRIFSADTCPEDRLINDIGTLNQIVDFCKTEGKKIVYTSGVYDLFHLGHALYLEKAKKCGDILIVGVDSDELTRSRKGPTRPVVPLDERVQVLIRNRAVDMVFVRQLDHDTDMVIKEIKPNVVVISTSTHDRENFIEDMKSKLGGYCDQFKIFAPQAETSTTARIRMLTIDGAQELGTAIQNTISVFLKGTPKQ